MLGYSTILFDYGGVIAAEGFREGLEAIGLAHGLSPGETYHLGKEIVYGSGFVVGAVSEKGFWEEFRRRSRIRAADSELRRQILSRFTPRPEMLAAAARLRQLGRSLAIVSDQTNWLDELNDRYHFFPMFDRIFNSYHYGRSKKEPQFFVEVVSGMGISPGEAVFLDDDPDNPYRAHVEGIRGLLVTDSFSALHELEKILKLDVLPVREKG